MTGPFDSPAMNTRYAALRAAVDLGRPGVISDINMFEEYLKNGTLDIKSETEIENEAVSKSRERSRRQILIALGVNPHEEVTYAEAITRVEVVRMGYNNFRKSLVDVLGLVDESEDDGHKIGNPEILAAIETLVQIAKDAKKS